MNAATVARAFSTVTAEENAAWEAWAAKNHHRYGGAQFNAFLAGYRAAHKTPPLLWGTTVQEHDEHRTLCPDTCPACRSHRAWGTCTGCGRNPKEANDEGLSYCCGSPVSFWSAA